MVDIIATNQPLEATWGNMDVEQKSKVSEGSSHLIGCGDHGHVNVRLSSNLLLWDDDLS